LIFQQEEPTRLGDVFALKFHRDAVNFDDIPVGMHKISVGQSVIAQGEMVGPNLLDIYRIEVG